MSLLPTYHKIQSVFKRDPDDNYKTFLNGVFTLDEFEYLAELDWVWTEKVDGTNIRLHSREEQEDVVYGGRTHRAELHKDLDAYLAELATHPAWGELRGLTVYGEGYGAGIQKGGGDYRKDKGFIVFDVMVTRSGTFLERNDVEEIARQLELPICPIVGVGSLWDAIYIARTRDDAVWSRLKADELLGEGFVMRPKAELRTRRGGRVIAKVKVKDFPHVD